MKGDNVYTNDELIEGVFKKDSKIISYIMERCYPAIKQMVLSNSGSKYDADEVFQEAMVILYRNVREGNFKLSSSIQTYLYSVSKLRWLQELRRKKPNEDVLSALEFDVNPEEDTIELINKNERLKLYREKFEELSKDCKKVLRMFLMKIPLAEITKIMGYSSEQIARNRRYRCKETLIKKIQESSKYKELGYGNNKKN